MANVECQVRSATCCLCLSEDESTFHSNSVMKSLPLHEMVNFCIGIEINAAKNREQLISTAICNECVLNINNFYTFKKKVLEAQELINSLSLNKEIGEHSTEYEEDEMVVQLVDEEPQLKAPDDEISYEMEKDLPSQGATRLIRIVKVDSTKRRVNDTPAQKHTNKKTKAAQPTTEKITIQMNECLICPAILGDILQLKDHIEAHKEIKCKACNRMFARYSNLKRHFNSVHSKPKPFQCDICGLGFNFSVNLQAHAALHYSNKIRKE